MMVGYIQFSRVRGNLGTIFEKFGGPVEPTPAEVVTPFANFLNLVSRECPISATASGVTWNNFQNTLNNFNPIPTLTQSSEFDQAVQSLGVPGSLGVGQYGQPGLLAQLNEQLSLLGSGANNLKTLFLQNGLIVGCDDDNYFVYSNEQYSAKFY